MPPTVHTRQEILSIISDCILLSAPVLSHLIMIEMVMMISMMMMMMTMMKVMMTVLLVDGGHDELPFSPCFDKLSISRRGIVVENHNF